MAKHATARSDAARSIQQALTLHQEGRLTEADALYGAVLAADPQHFDALHLRGVLHHQQGRSAEALRLVAAALKRHEEALENFDKVLEMRVDDAGTHYNRGNALKGLGRNAAALASYDSA